jgi:hypothetical protein
MKNNIEFNIPNRFADLENLELMETGKLLEYHNSCQKISRLL